MRIEFEKIDQVIEKLKPLPWKTYGWIVTASFISASLVSTGVGYLLVKYLKTTPSAQTSLRDQDTRITLHAPFSETDIKKILDRNIFNSENEVGDLSKKDQLGDGINATRTSLPIKLVGLIYGGKPESGVAMIENTQKKSISSFLVGELIVDNGFLKEVLRDRILISVESRLEYAPLEDVELRRKSRRNKKSSSRSEATSLAGGDAVITGQPPDSFKEEGFERKGGNIELSSSYKSRLLGPDFANVLQDAKASPNMTSEGIRGFRLDRIRKDSLYEKAGLMNGDIIEEINGVPLSDAAQAIKLMQSLRNENEIELRVSRSGTKLNFNLKVR